MWNSRPQPISLWQIRTFPSFMLLGLYVTWTFGDFRFPSDFTEIQLLTAGILAFFPGAAKKYPIWKEGTMICEPCWYVMGRNAFVVTLLKNLQTRKQTHLLYTQAYPFKAPQGGSTKWHPLISGVVARLKYAALEIYLAIVVQKWFLWSSQEKFRKSPALLISFIAFDICVLLHTQS